MPFGALDDGLEYGEPFAGRDDAEQPGLTRGFGQEVPAIPSRALGLNREDGRGAVRLDGLGAEICGGQRAVPGLFE